MEIVSITVPTIMGPTPVTVKQAVVSMMMAEHVQVHVQQVHESMH